MCIFQLSRLFQQPGFTCDVVFNVGVVFCVAVEFTGRPVDSISLFTVDFMGRAVDSIFAVGFTGRAAVLIGLFLLSTCFIASITQCFCGSAQTFLFLTVVNL